MRLVPVLIISCYLISRTPERYVRSLATQRRGSLFVHRQFRGHVVGYDVSLTTGIYSPSALTHPHFARLLSSSTQPPIIQKSPPATPSQPAPLLPTSRKPKVELRPGPIKPAAKTSTRSELNTPSVSSKLPTSSTQQSTTSSTPAPSTSSSILETTRQDLIHAHTHGIIPPPPPDAGRVQRMWHQLKEIFVCS